MGNGGKLGYDQQIGEMKKEMLCKLSKRGEIKRKEGCTEGQMNTTFAQTSEGGRRGGRGSPAILETLRLTVKFALGLCV